jgi:hypothetical protein
MCGDDTSTDWLTSLSVQMLKSNDHLEFDHLIYYFFITIYVLLITKGDEEQKKQVLIFRSRLEGGSNR